MRAQEKIKWKYLSIFFILFTFILVARVNFDTNQHEIMLQDKINILALDIEKEFKALQERVTDNYSMIASHYMQHKEVAMPLKENNREELYSLILNDYEVYKEFDPHLYIMHFFDTNNTTVLRMHKPLSYGDNLTVARPIVAYANKSLNNQNAFEVGKNGIVYRVTVPFFYKKKHLGILEFGIKPSYFVDKLTKQFDIKSTILVKTNSLKNLLSQKRYKEIFDYSIISSNDFFNHISSKINLTTSRQIVTVDSRTYIILTNLNLTNYQEETIAKVLVCKDITEFVKENTHSLRMANYFVFVAVLFVLMILYIVFTNYSNELSKTLKKVDLLHKKAIHFKDKANKDNLTQIYNKAHFDNYIKEYISLEHKGTIIFFDIDHFKKINDTHGHLIGDEILITLTKKIKNFLRSDDVFVRWGGEEFIILLENVSFDTAIKKAEEIRKLIESAQFIENISITISLGVTQVLKKDSKKSLLDRVDKLLYKAKKSGRNCLEHD